MALGNQIRHYREKLGLTLEQLSELSGVEVGTISALEVRNSSRSKFASPIAKSLGLTVEQLEDESADLPAVVVRPEREKSEASNAGLVRFERHPVPVSAGPGAVANTYGTDEIEFIEVAEWWARRFVGSTDSKRIKVVPCRGSSMAPTIPEGSLLFVDVGTRSHVGDGIYCIDLDQRLLVKRINVRTRDRVFEVVSDNKNGPKTETYSLSEEDRMCICGKVVAWLAVQKDG